MAPTKTAKKSQLSMDEKQVSNSELLALLEEREDKKEAVREVAQEYRDIDKQTKELIAKLATDPKYEPPYRVGPFLITKTKRESRHVEFDTAGSEGIHIANTEAKEE